MQHDLVPQTDVAISINKNRDFIIDKAGTLWLKGVQDSQTAFVSLFDGRITKQRIDFLIECLQRLRTFAD